MVRPLTAGHALAESMKAQLATAHGQSQHTT
jgi:hypothetical protein